MDLLDSAGAGHSWPLGVALSTLSAGPRGVAVLLNFRGDVSDWMPQLHRQTKVTPERGQMDLRTYGVGAQILRELGVRRMRLLGSPRRMPSMAGYGLEITGFTPAPA